MSRHRTRILTAIAAAAVAALAGAAVISSPSRDDRGPAAAQGRRPPHRRPRPQQLPRLRDRAILPTGQGSGPIRQEQPPAQTHLSTIETSEPGAVMTPHADQPHPGPSGTWTIDLTHSSAALTWGRLRPATVTGRLHCLGVIHLDDLPPVGIIQFRQPSGLPALTMALDPASVDTGDASLDTLLCGPDAFDVTRHRWWTLRSESLEVLPTGTWRVMATLTARGTPALVDLRFEVDPGSSDHDRLVLRGRGVLDRRTSGIGKPPSTRSPWVRLDLELRATRVTRTSLPEPQSGRVKNSATSSGPVVGSSLGS
jgi:polyisoprenoid-binding protein YceI